MFGLMEMDFKGLVGFSPMGDIELFWFWKSSVLWFGGCDFGAGVTS